MGGAKVQYSPNFRRFSPIIYPFLQDFVRCFYPFSNSFTSKVLAVDVALRKLPFLVLKHHLEDLKPA